MFDLGALVMKAKLRQRKTNMLLKTHWAHKLSEQTGKRLNILTLAVASGGGGE